jgi:hypothetical protein
MQTTNVLLLVVGALSVGVQAWLPRVAEAIARFFTPRRVHVHDIVTEDSRTRPPSSGCPGAARCRV